MQGSAAVLASPARIAEELSQDLEWAIVYGDLAPGLRLREEDISERYQVSRSPVREALNRLERDGLLVRRPRRGVTVPILAQDDLVELYGVRLSLEGQAAGEAARCRGPDDLVALASARADMETAARAGALRDFFRANLAFSRAIYRATGNLTLQRLLAIIEKQARRYRFVAFSGNRGLIDVSLAGNRRVLETIEARDLAAAEAVTRELIANSRDELVSFMSTYGAA